MNLEEYYQKGRYRDYDSGKRQRYYRNTMERIAGVLSADSAFGQSSHVLDAGCCDGGLVTLLMETYGLVGYGSDISPNGVKIARRSGIRARVADLSRKIPFPRASFSHVLAIEIIEHLANPDRFLVECRRVLKPGGVVVITTPNLSFWFNRILVPLGIYPMFLECSTSSNRLGMGPIARFASGQVQGHIHVHNLPSIRDLLSMHGFHVEKVAGIPLPFKSDTLRFVSAAYGLIDRISALRPSWSADLLIVARKQ